MPVRHDISPDEKLLATVGFWGDVFLWDTKTGEEVVRLKGSWFSFSVVRFSSDGNHVAAAGMYKKLFVWDVHDLSLEAELDIPDIDPSKPVSSIDFSPQGQWMIATAENNLYLWSLVDYSLKEVFNEVVTTAYFMDNEYQIFTDITIGVIFDITQKKYIKFFPGFHSILCNDKKKVINNNGNNNAIFNLWDIETEKIIYTSEAFALYEYDISPNCDSIVMRNKDNQDYISIVSLDNKAKKKEIQIDPRVKGNQYDLIKFSRNGKYIVLSNSNGLILYDIRGIDIAGVKDYQER